MGSLIWGLDGRFKELFRSFSGGGDFFEVWWIIFKRTFLLSLDDECCLRLALMGFGVEL